MPRCSLKTRAQEPGRTPDPSAMRNPGLRATLLGALLLAVQLASVHRAEGACGDKLLTAEDIATINKIVASASPSAECGKLTETEEKVVEAFAGPIPFSSLDADAQAACSSGSFVDGGESVGTMPSLLPSRLPHSTRRRAFCAVRLRGSTMPVPLPSCDSTSTPPSGAAST